MFTVMLRRAYRTDTPWHRAQKWKSVAFAFLLLILTTTLFFSIENPKSDHAFHLSVLKWNSFRSAVQFSPTVEFVNGTDVIWQIPDSPKAILFLAHGCNGRAANFWDRSQSCPNCVGLPEERLIVLNALAHKFAVITISSTGRCWLLGKEKESVKQIITWWIEKRKLEKLPLTALGASSGGYFVSALATKLKFSSITIMIAEGVFDYQELPDDYPPTLFVHMPKDRKRARLISEYMESLKKKGILVSEIRCTEFPLSPKFLSDRVPGVDEALSVKIFRTFHEKGIIDEKGFMVSDGRIVRWREALAEKEVLPDNYEWASHIQEELNLAFAYHEMTSLPIAQILDWFQSHLS
ncbi:uncharacterized protein LOC116259914 isoform X2 [Nymphaea colorata]|uniref:Peptidase S9 prolyl oligopeptidase catalytic domain-containing protein n=2 Tax=Nymphaea colorata TaxID=210225 RepID=A0A5K1G5I4_9MAGN|nr:uncharacterized protein LOC116259914 isoform X2 [Nymphaea colorata]